MHRNGGITRLSVGRMAMIAIAVTALVVVTVLAGRRFTAMAESTVGTGIVPVIGVGAAPAVGATPITSILPAEAAPAKAAADEINWSVLVPAAASIGSHAGLRAGVAVLDTVTGAAYSAGDTGLFGTASVVKVMIAAYLLDNGKMTGGTAALAYSMITRSDDDAANVLWGEAGAAGLEPWIQAHYDVPDLGSANGIPGRWGNTHVTAAGLAELYAKLKADPMVWPWLGNAMHHIQPIAKDGTEQGGFGIPAVVSAAAVKQGWADGSADDPDDAVINTTGFVDNDRYIVVVLTEGHHNNSGDDSRGFNGAEAAVVTSMVRELGVAALV